MSRGIVIQMEWPKDVEEPEPVRMLREACLTREVLPIMMNFVFNNPDQSSREEISYRVLMFETTVREAAITATATLERVG